MADKKKADRNPMDNWNQFRPRLAGMGEKTGRVRVTGDAGGGSVNFTLPLPYQPEFSDPSKVQWPIDRLQQNRYWRLYYKTDPVIGSVIDLFSEMIGSDFELTGEGIEGEVKDTFEFMIEKTRIQSAFKYFVTEYLTMGEVIPHLVFDKDKRIWTSVIFHNPDQIKVIDSNFIALDPILEFTPDEALRALARSTNPLIQKVFSKLPPEVADSIISGRNIPLDTTLNATFIARKIHPYDVRGTSIFTRVFRILMYEDAIMNASIATARRHAGPLKIAKIGDKDKLWVPEQAYQDEIVQLLTAAEADPHAFLILPWFVNFEAFGTTDKMMNVGREWDIIERIKLSALGVSQGFLHGEATYASMRGNMQTLLMRLGALRTYFESEWFGPKYFRPISEMNNFIKPSPAEVRHNFRVKRSRRELLEADRYIVPKLQWKKALDPRIDAELLDAYEQLSNRLKMPVSKTTAYTAASLDFEEEQRNLVKEKKREQEIAREEGIDEKVLEGKDEGGGGGGGGGGSPLLEMPPEGGEPEEGLGEETEAPLGEEPPAEAGPEGASVKRTPNRHLHFSDREVDDLVEVFNTGKVVSSWQGLAKKGAKNIPNLKWETVQAYLENQQIRDIEIQALREELMTHELEGGVREEIIESMVNKMSPDMPDSEINRVADVVLKYRDSKRKNNDSTNFFVGKGNVTKG